MHGSLLLTSGYNTSKPTIWNRNDAGSAVTFLTNNELTFSGDVNSGVRATVSHSSGKYYYENKIIALSTDGNLISPIMGIATSQQSLSSWSGGGYDYGLWSMGSGSGTVAIFHGNVETILSGVSPLQVNDYVGIAVDLTNNLIYFYKNGTIMNSGGMAITPGTYFPYAVYGDSGTSTILSNFGVTKLQYSPPSGFKSGW